MDQRRDISTEPKFNNEHRLPLSSVSIPTLVSVRILADKKTAGNGRKYYAQERRSFQTCQVNHFGQFVCDVFLYSPNNQHIFEDYRGFL